MKLELTPLVTVLMPCFNAEKYLDASIESIVHQTYQNLHILLIDDGSTDATLEICHKWSQKDTRIEIIQNKDNIGLIKTLNKGISLSNSPYLARMDADDVSAIHRIEKQIAFLLQNKEIAIVGTKSLPIDLKGNGIPKIANSTYIQPETLAFSSFFTQPFFHGSILTKTEVLKENPYSLEYKHSEDFELWLRLSNKGYKFSNIDFDLYYYRINPAGVSILNEVEQKKSHNKASKFYLEKWTKESIGVKRIEIINNRPSAKVTYKDFNQSMTLFSKLYHRRNSTPEMREYFIRQRVDICIQSIKNSNNLSSKLKMYVFMTFYCYNFIALKYMTNK